MAHHFRPLHDRVLLKRVEAEEKTPAGVIRYGRGEACGRPGARRRARIDGR